VTIRGGVSLLCLHLHRAYVLWRRAAGLICRVATPKAGLRRYIAGCLRRCGILSSRARRKINTHDGAFGAPLAPWQRHEVAIAQENNMVANLEQSEKPLPRRLTSFFCLHCAPSHLFTPLPAGPLRARTSPSASYRSGGGDIAAFHHAAVVAGARRAAAAV
jgi:hypothetical protein